MIDGVNQFWEICIFAIWRARRAARHGVRAVRGLSFLTPPEKGQMFPLAESFSSVLKSGAEAEAIAQDNLDARRRDCLNSDGSVRPLLRPAAVPPSSGLVVVGRRSSGQWPLTPSALPTLSVVRPSLPFLLLPLILLSTAVYVVRRPRSTTEDRRGEARRRADRARVSRAKMNEHRFKILCRHVAMLLSDSESH